MSSKQKLIQLFKNSDPDFDIEKLSISLPYPLEQRNDGNNTTVVIKVKDTLSGYMGNKSYNYHRKNLATLFQQIVPVMDLRNVNTPTDVIRVIENQFGLQLFESEFTITQPSLENGVTLTANESNYEYIGSITFKHALPLSKVTNITLNGFNYPTKDTNKIFASIYSRNIDMIKSMYFRLLKDGDRVDNKVFAKILSFYTGNRWDINLARSEYNLTNAVVTSLVSTVDQTTETHIVKIKLDPDMCSNLSGELDFKFSFTTGRLPVGGEYDFSTNAIDLIKLPKYKVITNEEANELNRLLATKGSNGIVTTKYTIVYHGDTLEVPLPYLNLVTQPTTKVCILLNGYDTKALPFVFSYNV